MKSAETVMQCVARRATITPDGCWLWPTTRSSGYATEWVPSERRNLPVHRVVYQDQVGPIPVGLVLDHLCRNRSCVNPAHLEPVTDKVNVFRGQAPMVRVHLSGKCVAGHVQTGARVEGSGPSAGRMKPCKDCRRERHQRRMRADPAYRRRHAEHSARNRRRAAASYCTHMDANGQCRCEKAEASDGD